MFASKPQWLLALRAGHHVWRGTGGGYQSIPHTSRGGRDIANSRRDRRPRCGRSRLPTDEPFGCRYRFAGWQASHSCWSTTVSLSGVCGQPAPPVAYADLPLGGGGHAPSAAVLRRNQCRALRLLVQLGSSAVCVGGALLWHHSCLALPESNELSVGVPIHAGALPPRQLPTLPLPLLARRLPGGRCRSRYLRVVGASASLGRRSWSSSASTRKRPPTVQHR